MRLLSVPKGLNSSEAKFYPEGINSTSPGGTSSRRLSSIQTTPMRPIFPFLSIAYIAGIFLFADSSALSYLKDFNPYSLLHIPLYAILTVLIIFSLLPLSAYPHINTSTAVRFFISGFIALIVAIADEIHQSFIPARDASVLDVFLDFAGIVLALFVTVHSYKRAQRSRTSAYQ